MVFHEEIEGFLGDSGHRFILAVAEGDEAEVVAFADHGFRGVHEAVADDGVSADGEEVDEDEDDADDGDEGEWVHHDAAGDDDFEEVHLLWGGFGFLGGGGERGQESPRNGQ